MGGGGKEGSRGKEKRKREKERERKQREGAPIFCFAEIACAPDGNP